MRALNSSPTASIEEAVIFPFDRRSMPFLRDLNLSLQSGRTNQAEMDHGLSVDLDERHPEGPVLTYGPPGSLDSTEIICPHVFQVDGEFRMWYVGGDDDQRRRSGLYAVSKDGFHWERPRLGLVEEMGSRDNNRVAGPCGSSVFYDPGDSDPSRRFKSIFATSGPLRQSASFSADGLHWVRATDSDDIFATGLEGGNIQKWGDCYYVNGQGGPSSMNRPIPHPIRQASKRLVATFASYDFVHWTHAAAMGLRRDPVPPRAPETFEGHSGEQIHEGVATWNRGNLLLGLYGQYRSSTNDRRDVVLDLGFAVSHDALHYTEPIPDFKMVHSYEIRGPQGPGAGSYAAPRLLQRNAWANIGDRSVYWFSVWREEASTWTMDNPKSLTGVWVATWELDRFGWFAPCGRNYGSAAGAYEPHCISCPVSLEGGKARLFVNADRLNEGSRLKIELLDEQFRPIPGYSGADCVCLDRPGLRQPVTWREREVLEEFGHPVRVRVDWEGIRREDARLFALYVTSA